MRPDTQTTIPFMPASESAGAPLRLDLPATLGAVEQARLAVLDHLRPHAPAARAVYRLEVVLEETLMNIISHAYTDALAHRIGLQLRVDAGRLLLRFEDDGIEFDPTRPHATPSPTTLAEAEPGGLGLQLVRRQALHMHYARQDGRNVLEIAVALA